MKKATRVTEKIALRATVMSIIMNQSELEGQSTKEAVYSAHFILLYCSATTPYSLKSDLSLPRPYIYILCCVQRPRTSNKKNNTESPVVRNGPAVVEKGLALFYKDC